MVLEERPAHAGLSFFSPVVLTHHKFPHEAVEIIAEHVPMTTGCSYFEVGMGFAVPLAYDLCDRMSSAVDP